MILLVEVEDLEEGVHVDGVGWAIGVECRHRCRCWGGGHHRGGVNCSARALDNWPWGPTSSGESSLPLLAVARAGVEGIMFVGQLLCGGYHEAGSPVLHSAISAAESVQSDRRAMSIQRAVAINTPCPNIPKKILPIRNWQARRFIVRFRITFRILGVVNSVVPQVVGKLEVWENIERHIQAPTTVITKHSHFHLTLSAA
ncbi:hypothetical protein JB92DRAFT_3291269 [Gautieria morchelliformis]|nr:hypothetical protein JB92DRAFT_3291269 [Gautieria morchelliformis]